jgi:GT2 family glycosyltransferase
MILQSGAQPFRGSFIERLFAGPDGLVDLVELYRLTAARIDAEVRAAGAVSAQTSLEVRQVWINSLLADRWRVQEIMDYQAEEIRQVPVLRRERAKAQLVMDGQLDQLRHWTTRVQQLEAERAKLKAEIKEQKQILNAARKACRRKSKCFPVPDNAGVKEHRPISERILREIKRVPRKLLGGRHRLETKLKAKGLSEEAGAGTTSSKSVGRYAEWIAEHEPSEAALKRQRAESEAWKTKPKISLLVPVFNTPANFLEEMLCSVASQSYSNWELCLVDAASTDAATVKILKNWIERESRIRFERLEANFGIAENTNRALRLVTGDYIGCLDHDDLLAPFALYEIARAILGSPEAEIVYSDEDRWSETGERREPYFKPEWSPELLYSSMYLGHLTVYRRDLVQAVGHFRSEFDLSQDYDFALRATERAKKICHVQGVLYHWREHPRSGSAGGKPEARKTNLAALANAMERRGLAAEIIEYASANRVRFKIRDRPKVSIIIPTDSAEHARMCIEQLPQATAYNDYEVVIVTNAPLAELLHAIVPNDRRFQFVPYDKAFNFSDKCNAGAHAATGERLIFFNDDVESGQLDWIENLIEPLENPDVGAVAPKLLYATGKIQHAGLVTGVRGFAGTACHEWPGDSVAYTNLAQSMRTVSALSAACLAVRREDFFRVGEFDAVNTPIAHSDLDLCFKLREAGLRCVYTPFVTMKHRGHASIGAAQYQEKSRPREKPSVYFLKRWAGYACHDPYYPDYMRDWLYADSPTPIRMWGRNQRELDTTQANLLFVSHDLSWSGAPLILFHTAKWCKEHGFFVTVMSPKTGPFRQAFVEAGIPLVIDPLITTGHPSFASFAQEFDCIVASTIFAAPIVHAAKSAGVRSLWWIHEGRVAEHYLGTDPVLRRALDVADLIVTPDTRSSLVYQPFADRQIRVLSYGIPDPRPAFKSGGREKGGPVEFLLLGTVEQRKGQLILLEALRQLPEDVLKRASFQIVGRPHDSIIAEKIRTAAVKGSYLTYREGVSPGEALSLIGNTDVVVSTSLDETGPLILMEALALGKAILSTTVGAVGEYLSLDEAGFFVPPGDVAALAKMIERLVREPHLIETASKKSRARFEKYFTFDRFGNGFIDLVSELTSAPTAELVMPKEAAV